MILAVETSWEVGSLALKETSAGEPKTIQWEKKSSHSEILTLQFQNLLDQNQKKITDVTKLIANIGPGSFTGIRVALSFVSSLSYAASTLHNKELPIVSINALEAMVYKSGFQGDVLVSLPAVKGHFYVGFYHVGPSAFLEKSRPKSVSQLELDELKAQSEYFVDGSQTKTRLLAEDLVHLYESKLCFFKEDSWKSLKPLYLRRSEAEEKLSSGLLNPMYSESEHQIGSKGKR